MKKLNMRSNNTEGILITFCGLDGCGKTTLIRKLMLDLEEGNRIYLTKQPTDFVRQSEIFRTYMDKPNHNAYDYRSLSLLAASDRLQHVNKVIVPIMNQGQIVLSDRYFYSCLANLRARGFKDDKWIYEIAESVIKPDIAFFLDVPVGVAVSRVRGREEEKNRFIDIELQYKLREEYIQICKENDGILIPTDIPLNDSYMMIKKAVERLR